MRLYVVIVALVGIVLIPTFILDDEIDNYFGGEEGLARLRAYGHRAWLVAVGLIVGDLVLPVPSTAVIAGLGMLYGPWLGGLIGGLGSTLAGVVAYAAGRVVGRPALKVLCGDADLDRLAKFFARRGTWAIALSRWMPLLPEALCGLAGSARMRFGPFLAAVLVGSLAMGFAFAFLGIHYVDRPAAGIIVSALIPLAVWPAAHHFLNRRAAGTGGQPVPVGQPAADGKN